MNQSPAAVAMAIRMGAKVGLKDKFGIESRYMTKNVAVLEIITNVSDKQEIDHGTEDRNTVDYTTANLNSRHIINTEPLIDQRDQGFDNYMMNP